MRPGAHGHEGDPRGLQRARAHEGGTELCTGPRLQRVKPGCESKMEPGGGSCCGVGQLWP